MDFKDNLKLFRRQSGIGQAKLAEMLNISPKTISHWETGYTEPCIAELVKLADVFDVTIDELVGRLDN